MMLYLDIACDRFNVISWDNSFITIEQDLVVNIPAHNSARTIKNYYICYKYAADAIDQYRM